MWLERVKGIEPSSSAWKAVALPLSYTRNPAFAGLSNRFYSDSNRSKREQTDIAAN
jgi:hypothetical protein